MVSGITYALEAVIEEGLREDFGAQGQTMVDRWLRLDPAADIFEKLNSRGAMFCSWSKAERERGFASLRLSFDALYEVYPALPDRPRTPESVAPRELEQWASVEWPDPRW
ncbi:unnamed protein product [Candidatus Paraburkholderia kirkii UZHbot1]|uniref:WGS project CAFE00000000 data, contig bkir_c134 n=1 Tax=Candidatus Paraburkholderia kirkii UZHbot1 TaxID=1055526 RepID=U3UAK0_9BURK|nr:unnamed protein product [Candidatus Paraburkholderia kirkii UZHbot1]